MKMWKCVFTPAQNPSGFAYVASGVATTGNEVAVYVGTSVSLNRQNEIVNGLKWLYNGLAERNLLDGAAWTGSIFTGANINALTAANRRTIGASGFPTSFTESDILVGMGQFPEAKGDTIMLRNTVDSLIDFLMEHTLKKV